MVVFHEIDIFENFIGKILYPSKHRIPQIEYNEIKL